MLVPFHGGNQCLLGRAYWEVAFAECATFDPCFRAPAALKHVRKLLKMRLKYFLT